MKEKSFASLPVFLVDDEESVLHASAAVLHSAGVANIQMVSDSRELLSMLEQQPASAVLLDLMMPHISGTKLLPDIVHLYPEVPVIVMTAAQDVETAVRSMKEGAFDYLVKPVEESRLVASVRHALEVHSLRRQMGVLKRYLLSDCLQNNEAFAGIITNSRKMRALFQYLEAVAVSAEPVLISGETGAGKEMFAQALHKLSGLSGQFVQVNVAGLDDTLFSDTLFGHKKGAFTGADQSRAGLIAQAAGGTLFLDEIGDLSMASQVKLLRLLQEHMYFPLGSDVARPSDARVVCATNCKLAQMMRQNHFRSDLFFPPVGAPDRGAAATPAQGRHPAVAAALSRRGCGGDPQARSRSHRTNSSPCSPTIIFPATCANCGRWFSTPWPCIAGGRCWPWTASARRSRNSRRRAPTIRRRTRPTACRS
jgi:DNA-binding NtrC family response regulator